MEDFAAETSFVSVLSFGEPLVVLVPDEQGNLEYVHDFRTYPAGAEMNTAIGLARLQIPVSFAAGVGRDPFGKQIERELRSEGVDVQFVDHLAHGQTGIFFKQWSGLRADTSVFYYRSSSPMAVGSWNPTELRAGLLKGRWNWVHSTGITWMLGDQTRNHATELLQRAHKLGISVSFDVNIRLKLAAIELWKGMVREISPYLTWFFVGDKEAMQLFDTEDPIVVESAMRTWGFSGTGIIVKQGARGSVASVGGSVTSVGTWEVENIVDSIGAGDGYNAGWIAGMLRGWSLEKSMRLGSLVGAYALTSRGDSGGYPTWSEVMRHFNGEDEITR